MLQSFVSWYVAAMTKLQRFEMAKDAMDKLDASLKAFTIDAMTWDGKDEAELKQLGKIIDEYMINTNKVRQALLEFARRH